MINTIFILVVLTYIAINIVWNRSNSRKLEDLSNRIENIQAMVDRTDRLQMLAIEELNQFVINKTRDIEKVISQDLQSLTSDLDRTIGSIDSIQEKIAELEVSVQNVINRMTT